MDDSAAVKALGPRESAAFICSSAKNVTIDLPAVARVARDLVNMFRDNQAYTQHKAWKKHPLNPKVADESAIDWIFLVDALNFSFWTPAGAVKYRVDYEGASYTGYWSLCAAVNRALDEGKPLLSAEYLANISLAMAADVFRSNSAEPMPLLEERVRVMNEVGRVLLDRFDGRFANCVRQAGGSAQVLLELVLESFPCFRDEAVFRGRRVSLYKRAQILVADVWACFEGRGLGSFSDIDTITMFADYRIPQALVYFGVMKYGEELRALLERDHMFGSGDEMEVEIRGASIHAVELLCGEMNAVLAATDGELKGVTVNAVLLDHFLWDYRRAHDAQTKHVPFHKIRCIYY